jgi:hypothetical protein
VIPWDVPLKEGKALSTLAVNWNWGIHHAGWRMRWSPESDDPTQRDRELQPELCEKFLNTKLFHEGHCHECNSSKA